MEIKDRIMKDINIFSENLAKVDRQKLDVKQRKVVELAEMYAKDARSWFDKGDYYTAFSSISYAHGLLDSIIAQNSASE
ncbi:MAG: DUF357 domain-containing protein [Candidatus Micrarchaeota archaeon]|nr:DUF357 domain-containing protein [Candidatus Micrarchaeota archaeon]